MHLIELDSNNIVVSVTPVAQARLLTALATNLMLGVSTPIVGQIFDPLTQTFAHPPRRRWLTRLAFDSRFSMEEAVELKKAQVLPTRLVDEQDSDYNARCTVPLTLQVMQSRLSMASYIDLDRADTQVGVRQLEALGLIGVGRADAILEGLIAAHEYHPEA